MKNFSLTRTLRAEKIAVRGHAKEMQLLQEQCHIKCKIRYYTQLLFIIYDFKIHLRKIYININKCSIMNCKANLYSPSTYIQSMLCLLDKEDQIHQTSAKGHS